MPRTLEYRASDLASMQDHPDVYNWPAFGLRNRLLQLVWNTVWLFFYRFSPRPLHAWRALLLRLFGAQLGPEPHVYPGCRVWAPWNLIAGDHFAAADGVEIYNPSPMHFGSHVILSQGAYLCGATHDYNDPAFPLLAFTMRFGDYSWICARAIVGPGVQVGTGAVLGLGAVTTRDLEPWKVYTGNAASAVKTRVRPEVEQEADR